MKPAKVHYILAHGFRLSTWGVSVIFTGILGWVYFFNSGVPIRELLSLWSILLILLTLPIGWLLGGLVIWPFVGSIANKMNGAPFHVGENVCILIGSNCGKEVRIYDVWNDRHQVRVELGEQAKADLKDVFSFHQVCRTTCMTK